MNTGPLVQQRITGPGIEAHHRAGLVGGQIADVGDAAEVQYHAVMLGRIKQPAMEGRCQRRACTVSGDIARAEIRHRGDAGALGDDRRVADLNAVGLGGPRLMAQGLAVTADGGHLCGRDP